MTSLFRLSTSLSLVAIFQDDQRARVCVSNYDFWLTLMYLHTFLAYSTYLKAKTHENRDNKQSSPLKENKVYFS